MKWGLLSFISVITLSVWGGFFILLFQEVGYVTTSIEKHYVKTELINPSDAAIKQALFAELQEEGSELSDENKTFTLSPANFPQVKKGDAIGYGPGISVDDLLKN